jgi:hypothetical protein
MGEDPRGSNTGKFVIGCQRYTWLPGTGWPWCVAFVQRVFAEVNLKLPWGSAGAWDLYERAKKAGWAKKVPKPGDIAIWNIGSGHASIVRRVLGDYVETIDGNVGDKVTLCRRSVVLARGFIRHPGLTLAPVDVPDVKPPKKETVGSASGDPVIVYRGMLHGWLAKASGNPWNPPNQDRKKT